MARQTRKYSRLKNIIQEVKFIYNIYKMYSIFLNIYSRYLFTIQDFQNTFKSYGLGYEKHFEYEKKNLE